MAYILEYKLFRRGARIGAPDMIIDGGIVTADDGETPTRALTFSTMHAAYRHGDAYEAAQATDKSYAKCRPVIASTALT